MIITRRWKTRKCMIFLLSLEFLFTVAALTLFALAQPNEYRTLLWKDGSDNGFNSSPDQALYNYANHRKVYKTPIVWSQFITDYNVVISVLSMFILLAKSVMFVMHTLLPILSVLIHVAEVALYAVSTYGQSASDLSDPKHPRKGAPWYIAKKCSVVHTRSNYGHCQQAKACFAITLLMLIMFSIYLILAIFSCIPTKAEKAARRPNFDRPSIPKYAPDNESATEMQWVKQPSEVCSTPIGASAMKGQPTPRTVAFHSLEGSPRALPLRERYGQY